MIGHLVFDPISCRQWESEIMSHGFEDSRMGTGLKAEVMLNRLVI